VDLFPDADGPPQAQVMQEADLLSLGVKLVAFSDPSDIRQQARWAAWGGGSAGAALGLLMLYLAYRQRSIRQMAVVQDNLRRAHDELEHLVDERTLQLQQANQELQSQIAERVKVQEELIQAGKLAVLGQMSAEISHEINQPLTALRAMSTNTIKFFELGRTSAAVENLRAIGGIVDRMERVARQLKSFVRKTPGHGASFALQAAVCNVEAMLEHRLRSEGVEMITRIHEQALVACDRDRLEQVLLNLCSNAIDAMAGCATRRLTVTTASSEQRWRVQVADTGVGMDEARLHRLFEPFFTTKPAGEGLGLGLVIAANIVREFGSHLRAHKADVGMVFEFELDSAAHRRTLHA
jgi:two-component system C4-dicarboxylate transport sensor histidine kinase DctB